MRMIEILMTRQPLFTSFPSATWCSSHLLVVRTVITPAANVDAAAAAVVVTVAVAVAIVAMTRRFVPT